MYLHPTIPILHHQPPPLGIHLWGASAVTYQQCMSTAQAAQLFVSLDPVLTPVTDLNLCLCQQLVPASVQLLLPASYLCGSICMVCSVAQSCPTLCDPKDCSPPLSMGFSRQEYWSGLPCPPPGDLPNPGIKPESLISPALAAGFFTTSTTWEAQSAEQKRLKCGNCVGWGLGGWQL